MVSHTLSTPMTPDSPARADQPVSRWLSIRWALPAMMLLPLIGGIGLTGWLAFRSSRAAVTELIQAVSGEVTQRIEQRLSDRIDELNLVNNLVTAQFQEGDLSLQHPAAVRQEFWRLVRLSPIGDAIIYSDDEGNFIQVKRLQNDEYTFSLRNAVNHHQRHIYALDPQGKVIGEPEIQDYDPRQRPWYQAAVKAQVPLWSDIYQSITPPDLTITRTTPLPASDQHPPIVIGIDVHLQSLSQFLQSLEIGKTGRAFIIDRSGAEPGGLVATSAGMPFQITESAPGQQEVMHITATASPDTQIRETALYLQETYGSFDYIPESEPIAFRQNGHTHWVDVYTFKDHNLDWLVVVTIPEADFAAQIQKSAKHTLIMGGAITGAVALLSVLLSLWLVRPITRLTRAATNIKQNNYQPHDLSEVTQRPDELGELAALFDDMALVVNSREQGLSEQVASLRSQIAHYDHLADRQKQSAQQVLQRSQQFRQSYQHRQS